MWIVYALLSALSDTFAVVITKKILIKERAVEFAMINSLYCAIIAIPLLFFVDFSVLPAKPLLFALLFSCLPGALGFYLISRSVRHLEISIIGPLFVLNPGMVALLAYFFLNEKTTMLQMLGIAILLIGSYVLELNSTHKLLDPIKIFLRSKYLHLVIIALFLYAIENVYDRYMLSVHKIPFFSYFVLYNIGIGFMMSIIYIIFHRKTDGIKHGLANYGGLLFFTAIFDMVQRMTMFLAASLAFVSLATAIRRMSAIFTVIIGGEIFHENNIVRKILATTIMVVGAILISI